MECHRVEKYMLGVDIGTTNVKAALYSYAGQEIFVESASYSLYTDESGAATQSITEIKNATLNTIKKVIRTCKKRELKLSFLSFSSVMHSLLLVDAQGEVLTPVFTWGDRRAEPFVEKIRNKYGSDIYHRTGTPLHPMSPLVKIIWLNETSPEIVEKADKIIDVKAFIMNELFDDYYTDYSVANASGLFNMQTLDWDQEALEITALTEDKLPKLVPTTHVFKHMNPEIATELGLTEDVPVVIGATDGCLANLGVNAMKPGAVALTIGTSGAIRTVTDKPLTDIKERTFCYNLTENHWVIGGPVNNGGVVLDWAMERFMPTQVDSKVQSTTDSTTSNYQQIMEVIESVAPGADDLFFYPYLVGERAPIWRADVKGSFWGLSLHHQNAHILRAVLEGINFNLYAVYQAISEVIGTSSGHILATGGFTKSEPWLQMLSDIFNLKVTVVDISENACFGAALLGLLALGEMNDFSAVEQMLTVKKEYVPNKERSAFYKEQFKKYMKYNQHILDAYEDS